MAKQKTVSNYDLILTVAYGNKHSQIIKVLKEKLDFDDESANSIVNDTPRTIIKNVTLDNAQEWKAELVKAGADVIMMKHGACNEYYTCCVYTLDVRSFGNNKAAIIKALVANGYDAKKAEELFQSQKDYYQGGEKEKEKLINDAKRLVSAGADLVVNQKVYSYYSQTIEDTQEDKAPDVDTVLYSVWLYPQTSPESIVDVLRQHPLSEKKVDEILEAKRWIFDFNQNKRGSLKAANELYKALNAANADLILFKRRDVVIPIEPEAVEEVVDEKKQLETKKKEDLTDLLPIKGISVAMKKALSKKCNIYDIPGLLCNGATLEDRQKIAKALGINTRYVTIWLKQADLWRVPNMDSNLAYLAVLAGIRHVGDYAKADPEKLMAVFKTLVATHPDLECPTEKELSESIRYATVFVTSLTENSYVLNVDEEEKPVRLFTDDFDQSKLKTDSEIISEGLQFLQDIEIMLPLPHIISGRIKMRKNVELIEEGIEVNELKVEMEGIANPSEEKKEDEKNLFTYTDASGYFMLVLPDKYNMQDTITFIVSQGVYKQKFVKPASELLEKVYVSNGDKKLKARELIEKYDQLDAFNKEIIKLEEKRDTYYELLGREKEKGKKKLKSKERVFLNNIKASSYKNNEKEVIKGINGVECEIEEKETKRDNLIQEIYGYDSTTNDLEKTLTNLLARTDFRTDLGDLVLNYNVFTKNYDDKPKALPSVRLMGEGETAVKLPTDTAPSRVFNYNMIQRLVEPAVYPPAGKTEREKLDRPVDVINFKKNMAENPSSIPQMASLGIGYVLNMHQAWVPDGFALGTLLYSTILAPGEEQRLVVRENTQSYEIKDSAEGSDAVSEDYATSQEDDTTAAYNYAVNQLMTGQSSSQYQVKSTSVGFSAGGGYMGASLGLNVGHSKTSGSASASASQSNSHNEASEAAQRFQHGIKTASERMSQARRVSMRVATSSEKDSVATRIIANHNHSHAMTIQYWEVVRRYKLETSIDSIDLMLFVPLKPIQFLPVGQTLFLKDPDKFNQQQFNDRYVNVLRFYDTLSVRIPYKYRSGLNLVQKYASYPKWEFEHRGEDINSGAYTLAIRGNFLDFDVVKATMYLSNGKGVVAGQLLENHPGADTLDDIIERYEARTKIEVEEAIVLARNTTSKKKMQFSFHLPSNVDKQDVAYIRLDYSCKTVRCKLFGNYTTVQAIWHDPDHVKVLDTAWSQAESLAVSNYLDKVYDYYHDNNHSTGDMVKISHYTQGLPENFIVNEIDDGFTMTDNKLRSVGGLAIDGVKVKNDSDPNPMSNVTLSSYTLDYNSITIDISSHIPVMRYDELQKMEAMLQHVANETLHYSQMIWAMLSDSERAMMLERYTVDMNFQSDIDRDIARPKTPIDIPLLNCINVKKPLGFYGNCMMFPFTYPESLAKKVGKTAAELQDALYRYHTSSFRVPSTVISLPTNGMIGEAVLGETNVSEEIDLTRFWNWKDSPIDSMEINENYLNGTDYLKDKTTKDISALNLQSATATQAVTVPDLISALVSKQTPKFDNITGLDQITSMLGTATSSNAAAQSKVVENSNALATSALNYATEKLKAEKEQNVENAKQATMAKAIEKNINPYQTSSSKDNKTDKGNPDTDPSKENQPKENQPKENQHTGDQPKGDQPKENQPTGDQPKENQPKENQPTGNDNQHSSQPADTSDWDDFFDDVNIDEFGLTDVSPSEANKYKCVIAMAAACNDSRYKSFKEFQRLQNKWKEQKKKKKLTNEDLMALALRAGAFMHKNGITTKEITAYSNTLLEKHNLDEE